MVELEKVLIANNSTAKKVGATVCCLGTIACRAESLLQTLCSRYPPCHCCRTMTRPIAQVKVLIVERAPTMAALIASTLRSHGYAIAGIVNSGERALEFATATLPDVVLVDIDLSGYMDGITTAWKISHECYCPVIYMTTHRDDEILTRSQITQPAGYLLKPFTSEELGATIQTALNQRSGAANEPERLTNNFLSFDSWNPGFMTLLTALSQIQPMPRVLFENSVLSIHTHTLDDARLVSERCSAIALSFPHQILTWDKKQHQFNPYHGS